MTVLIALRLIEYAAASLLFGAPLLMMYAGLTRQCPPQLSSLLILSAALLALTAPLHFLIQTADIADLPLTALDAASLKAAFLQMHYGPASLVRGLAALAALAGNLMLPADRRRGHVNLVAGAVICASFAWMGHGAVGQGVFGWLHLCNDTIHTLAAAAWIGALAVFVLWLMREEVGAALRGFSGFGIAFTAVLAATGLVNALFMFHSVQQLWQSLYGRVLMVKVALFLAMLGLAARNRALVRMADEDVVALRRNLLTETTLGFVVLALVAWLGMLEPP